MESWSVLTEKRAKIDFMKGYNEQWLLGKLGLAGTKQSKKVLQKLVVIQDHGRKFSL